MAVELVNLDDYAKRFGHVWAYETPPSDSPQYRIFKKEQQLAGLADVKIDLLMPEHGNFPYKREKRIAYSSGSRKKGYTVTISASPRGAIDIHPKWQLDAIYRGWDRHPLVLFSALAAHELAHIKNGDCDDLQNWPAWLTSIVKPAFEQRALHYEKSRVNKILAEGKITF